MFICIHPLKYVGNGLCAVPLRCNYNPCGQNGTTPRSCHSERTNVSRGIFPSGRFYLVVVHSPTWWIPPLRLRCGRNDNDATFLRIRLLFPECFRLPRCLISQGCALPASPEGKLLYRALGCRSLSVTAPAFHVRNGTLAVPYGFAGRGTFSTEGF